jgi:phosphohistidine phosphatase SixA
MSNLAYVLLMRHAKHEPVPANTGAPRPDSPLKSIAASLKSWFETPASGGKPDVAAPVPGTRQLSEEGRKETEGVAQRLKEQMEEAGEGIRIGAIFHAQSPEATATANILKTHLGIEARPVGLLKPATAFAREEYRQTPGADPNPEALGKVLKKAIIENAEIELAKPRMSSDKQTEPGNAVLVVGHQPLLGWMSAAWVKNSWPLLHSELACLAVKESGARSLRWLISPANDPLVAELKEKIKSKMQLAGLLGGFISAGLGFFLSSISDPAKMPKELHLAAFGVGAILLFLALLLYLTTMCAYDSLLMPHPFWNETPAGFKNRPSWLVARPPSSARWVLYQNMIRVWSWQFLPATYLAMTGLFLLGSACLLPKGFYLLYLLPVIVAMFPILKFLSFPFREVSDAWLGFWSCRGLFTKFRYLCGPWLGSED